MKPYQQIPIEECGEALVAIPIEQFACVTPHPYVELGAPYGSLSPYFLRQGVVKKLLQAQAHLQQQKPGWRLQIFDAYRPIPVQQFMVDYAFEQLVWAEGLAVATLDGEMRSHFQTKVSEFWAVPSLDPHTPPPHSTGAAVDLTLVNADGKPVNMGSAIDELSPRSHPRHFAECKTLEMQQYHLSRSLLTYAMSTVGFRQHPNEWWHFSMGDQLWAWQVGNGTVAIYGGQVLPDC